MRISSAYIMFCARAGLGAVPSFLHPTKPRTNQVFALFPFQVNVNFVACYAVSQMLLRQIAYNQLLVVHTKLIRNQYNTKQKQNF